MTQFFTDFSEYSVGSSPNDWSEQWGNSTNEVISDAGVEGGVKLNHLENSGTHSAFAWEDKDSADIEIVTKLQFYDVGATSQGIAGRVGSDGSGYKVDGTDFGTNAPRIIEIVENETLAQGSKFIDDDMVGWFRFRCNGNTLEAKFWEDGTGEPSSFDVSVTDSTHSSGLPAVSTFSDRDVDYHLFGVGTNGDTAPTEPVETGETFSQSITESMKMGGE